MSITIHNIVRRAKTHSAYNILCFPHDGFFERMLCQAFPEHHFYGIKETSQYPWNTQALPPEANFHLLPPANDFVPPHVDFDFILCNNHATQWDNARRLASEMHLPIVLMEHMLMPPSLKPEEVFLWNKNNKPCVRVFTDQRALEQWGTGKVVPYGIPDYEWMDKKDQIAISGDFVRNEIPLLQELSKQISIPMKFVGHSPDVSPIITSPNELEWAIGQSRIFLNIKEAVYVPIMLLEAMARGCTVITTASPLLDDIVIHGKTGYIIKSLPELKQYLNKPSLGEEAAAFVKKLFNFKSFVAAWAPIFNKAATEVYTR